MPGSPRVERAANIRIQHPNLSTEDAMKLAGYTDEEAKDPKRQSNVRQKTHRLTKGRKRQPMSQGSGSDYVHVVQQDAHRKRLSMDGQARATDRDRDTGVGTVPSGDFVPLPIDYDNPVQSQVQFDQQGGMKMDPLHYHTPQRDIGIGAGGSTLNAPLAARTSGDLPVTPGSARAEKAARFWLDNPNLSIEHAMKLAGYPDVEIKDTYKQNDIRQTAHQITVQIAAKTQKNTGMSTELRGRLNGIERKMDDMAHRLERSVDIKLKELGARIDDKFNYLHQHIHVISGSSSSGSTNTSSTAASANSNSGGGSYPPYSNQPQHSPSSSRVGNSYPPANSNVSNYPRQQGSMYGSPNMNMPMMYNPHQGHGHPVGQQTSSQPPYAQPHSHAHSRSHRPPDDTIAL